MRERRVAVLGAGIMGSSTALHLAREGAAVTLFDRAQAPFQGASRWNEGKIHLGFVYANDPTLDTARAMLAGGLGFKDQVEQLTGTSLTPAITPTDEIFLVHRDSVTMPDAASRYLASVAELMRGHPDARRYLTDVSRSRVTTLAPSELDALADPSMAVAGYRIPERSVDTNYVADAFVHAVDAEPLVAPAMGQEVAGVSPAGDDAGRWVVHTGSERHGPFDAVVNALWQGRPRIDRSAGHRPDFAGQHRYRVSLFVETEREVEAPNVLLAVGPFGDLKNYGGRSFCLSWYPAGLLARSESVDPPRVPELSDPDRERIISAILGELDGIFGWTAEIARAAAQIRVEGGWVYSQGRGTLDDPAASVHRRDRLGTSRLGSYFSVDTGKFAVAPHLAEELARTIVASI